jgi:hypothetical protein
METIAIKSKESVSLNTIKELLSQHWPVETSTDETLVVHGNNTRAYLYPSPGPQGTEQLDLFVDYTDVEFAKSILEKIANDPAVIIDNDFGTVLPGDQFVARCKSERGWNWKTEGLG